MTANLKANLNKLNSRINRTYSFCDSSFKKEVIEEKDKS